MIVPRDGRIKELLDQEYEELRNDKRRTEGDSDQNVRRRADAHILEIAYSETFNLVRTRVFGEKHDEKLSRTFAYDLIDLETGATFDTKTTQDFAFHYFELEHYKTLMKYAGKGAVDFFITARWQKDGDSFLIYHKYVGWAPSFRPYIVGKKMGYWDSYWDHNVAASRGDVWT